MGLNYFYWGFPLSLKGKSGQPLKPKPVNNARTAKLDSFMWKYSFQERRCLIPVIEFCEAGARRVQRRGLGSRCPMTECSRSPAYGATLPNGAMPIR